MWISILQLNNVRTLGVRFSSGVPMGGDEEEECCDKDDDENEHKKINYHSKRRPSGMLNLTHKERESLRYVFPIICFGFFRR